MKKLFSLLLLVILIFSAPTVNAQTNSASSAAYTKYFLAYPGMLPDNPLYKLKVLRDKITEILISDPEKKTEFYLLQTDKGLNATSMLVDKNKIELAIHTALKAENNYTLLTYELKKMKKLPENDLMDKLKLAAEKHQQVLNSIIDRVPKESKSAFTQVLNFSKTNLSSVEKLEKTKKD